MIKYETILNGWYEHEWKDLGWFGEFTIEKHWDTYNGKMDSLSIQYIAYDSDLKVVDKDTKLTQLKKRLNKR